MIVAILAQRTACERKQQYNNFLQFNLWDWFMGKIPQQCHRSRKTASARAALITALFCITSVVLECLLRSTSGIYVLHDENLIKSSSLRRKCCIFSIYSNTMDIYTEWYSRTNYRGHRYSTPDYDRRWMFRCIRGGMRSDRGAGLVAGKSTTCEWLPLQWEHRWSICSAQSNRIEYSWWYPWKLSHKSFSTVELYDSRKQWLNGRQLSVEDVSAGSKGKFKSAHLCRCMVCSRLFQNRSDWY